MANERYIFFVLIVIITMFLIGCAPPASYVTLLNKTDEKTVWSIRQFDNGKEEKNRKMAEEKKEELCKDGGKVISFVNGPPLHLTGWSHWWAIIECDHKPIN